MPTESAHRSTLTKITSGALLLVVLAVAIQVTRGRLFADRPYEASVAIMPFENRTGDPRFDYLGPSLAEGVITQLATVPEIRVLDLYTAASVMKDSLGTPRLHDTLNVEHIIHGYIENRGDTLVVNVSESDVEGFLSLRTRHILTPERLESDQVDLANRVVLTFLRDVGLEDRYAPHLSVVGPGRDAYLAGAEALGQRTPTAMREAIRWFREAIALEPTSAVALSALSSAYALAVYYKYDVGMSSYELAARSFVAADSAIVLDPEEANGYAARGYVRALLGVEIDEAEADFARAQELAPNAPNGPSWSARILARRDRVDEAFAEAERARDLDPLQAGRRTALASLGFQLGAYDVSIAEAREAYRLEPRLSLARAFEGRALALTGRADECLRLDFEVYELVRALCLHAAGRTAEALAVVNAAEARLSDTGIDDPSYLPELTAQDLAAFYGYVGNAEAAGRWVEYAFELSPAGVDERLLGSALFDLVRDRPEYSAALAAAREDARARFFSGRRSVESPL